ncbi:MAG: glycoside hydrolase family 125 protein [Mariniphaga sp.]
MTNRRNFLIKGGVGVAAIALSSSTIAEAGRSTLSASNYASKRPEPSKRKFTSRSVEATITRIKAQIKDPKLAWLFENCYPNTLDTTVNYKLIDNKPDTFVVTGDINAMWLRDSSAQVWPYLAQIKQDEPLRLLIAGVVNRQTKCVNIDPYANSFNEGPTGSEWKTDQTTMKPELHERKWEIDSLCYTVRLAYNYWKTCGDTSVFSPEWKKAAALIMKTFKEQQRKKDNGPYSFLRVTDRQFDTLSNNGLGNPVKPVGLIVSSFRPSDDSSTYGFLVPSNLFAITSLKQLAEISEKVTADKTFAAECLALASEVQNAVNQNAILAHPKYGKVYAFEVDGFGNALFMDDANLPSLLGLPYLGSVPANDPVYQNTRKLIWSLDNPYFFKGKAAEGIGGPHIGYDMIWPMSLIMRAMTSSDDKEIVYCLKTLRDTDAETGFMHESFHKEDPTKFTRKWFAWVNTLFGELIVKLEKEGKINLLNNI